MLLNSFRGGEVPHTHSYYIHRYVGADTAVVSRPPTPSIGTSKLRDLLSHSISWAMMHSEYRTIQLILCSRLANVSMTTFGSDVLPEVNWRKATS